MIGYSNPVSDFAIGDVVQVGNGKVEWTVVGKGATSGLSLKNSQGRSRSAQAFEVRLIRTAETDRLDRAAGRRT
jgi:hypothetical protein